MQTRPRDSELSRLTTIVVRRKALFISTVAACLAVGLLYLTLKQPTFQATARVQIGHVAGGNQLEAADTLAARLLSNYGENQAEGVKRTPPFLERATTLRNTNVLELVSKGHNPEEAISFLKLIIDKVLSQHGTIFKENMAIFNNHLKYLDNQRMMLRSEHEEMTLRIAELGNDVPTQAAIIAIERARVADALSQLEKDRPDIEQKTKSPEAVPTAILGELVAPVRRSSPPPATTVLLAALVIGAFLGIGLALVTE